MPISNKFNRHEDEFCTSNFTSSQNHIKLKLFLYVTLKYLKGKLCIQLYLFYFSSVILFRHVHFYLWVFICKHMRTLNAVWEFEALFVFTASFKMLRMCLLSIFLNLAGEILFKKSRFWSVPISLQLSLGFFFYSHPLLLLSDFWCSSSKNPDRKCNYSTNQLHTHFRCSSYKMPVSFVETS